MEDNFVAARFNLPNKHYIVHDYPSITTVWEVKKDLGKKFQVNPEYINLTQRKTQISNECSLSETEFNEFGVHKFKLRLKLPPEIIEHPPILDINTYNSNVRLPEKITVNIPCELTEDGSPKNMVVEIKNKAIVKPELCCYRNKRTGTVYTEGFTQTGPVNIAKWVRGRYVSRDTQTRWYKPKTNNTAHDQTSQCYQDGVNVLFLSSSKDIIITPQKYITYLEKKRIDNVLGKIQIMQRHCRRFIIGKCFLNARNELRRLEKNFRDDEQKFYDQHQKRLAYIEHCKLFPRTRPHFELLYNEVFNWRTAEIAEIKRLRHGAGRISEIISLLYKESRMLVEIDANRVKAMKERLAEREDKILKNLGKPVEFISYKDTKVHLDLLRTQRARFLNNIYEELKTTMEIKERLALLRRVKRALVNEKSFPKLVELYELIDREERIIKLTRVEKLDLLRARQNFLFQDLIRQYQDPYLKETLKKMCDVCYKVKTIDEFDLNVRSNAVYMCGACQAINLTGKHTLVYKSILRAMQRDEHLRHSPASFAFIMQVDDVRHIIQKIWHGKSILSKCDDIKLLRLPRWDRTEPWSPWNCICVTEIEARYHNVIKDLKTTYDARLHMSVQNHHLLARKIFHTLAEIGIEHLETYEWWNVGMNKQRKIPPLPRE